jgi:hypothetical protein
MVLARSPPHICFACGGVRLVVGIEVADSMVKRPRYDGQVQRRARAAHGLNDAWFSSRRCAGK